MDFSQFFAHEVPMWTDKASTAVETVKAISIMGAMNNKGTLVHSYLEDGFPALFQDCATVAEWAFLERYIVEKLLNAKLSHCIGGLTSDPFTLSCFSPLPTRSGSLAGWLTSMARRTYGDK